MILKSIREESGLGLREAARAIGVNASQLSEWENGKHGIDTSTLVRLADFYQERLGRPIAVDHLIGRSTSVAL